MIHKNETWWKRTKNHLKITKLAWTFGGVETSIKSNIKLLTDQNLIKDFQIRLNDLEADNKKFNGDDGSSQNLVKYENLLKKLFTLEQEVKNALKK